MFDKRALQSQQLFLKAQGLYHGAIDGVWETQSRNAMSGYACVNDAGNADGSPFTVAPVGVKMEQGCLLPEGSELADLDQFLESETGFEKEATTLSENTGQDLAGVATGDAVSASTGSFSVTADFQEEQSGNKSEETEIDGDGIEKEEVDGSELPTEDGAEKVKQVKEDKPVKKKNK